MSSDSFQIAQIVVAIIAAVISAASAAIIAWQAIQTRRSTKVAQDAVEIARAELVQGEKLREDALRAQIDAEMPRITVTARLHAKPRDPRESVVPLFFASDAGVNEPERLTQAEYVLPSDAAKELCAYGTVKIVNDGPRHLQATIAKNSGQQLVRETLDLAPGERKSIEVKRLETVGRWVEIARWLNGDLTVEPPHEVRIFQFSYRFPGWIGAVENHEVVMGGTVLEPVAGNSAAWRPANLVHALNEPDPIATLAPQPFERLYFRNRPGDDTMGWF